MKQADSNHQQPKISAQIVRHIRDCLELAGVRSAALLNLYGISPEAVSHRDHVVSLSDYLSFFEAAAGSANNPHFGMQAARLMTAEGLGPLSFLFLSAPTLGQAFQTFTEYLDAMQEATFNAFVVEGSFGHFTYGIRDDALTRRRQDSEYSIGVMCNLLRQYLGQRSAPAEVHFEHERVGALAFYEDYFDCPVYFEQPHNRLCVPAEWLGRSSSALSTELFPIIADHLKARMQAPPEAAGMAARVTDILLSHPPENLPTLPMTAQWLGCSRATLMRRLAAEGHSYGDLLAERRIGHARRLLASSARSVADIALACGYAETASFTRAFRHRVGMPPSRWRSVNAVPRARVVVAGKPGKEA